MPRLKPRCHPERSEGSHKQKCVLLSTGSFVVSLLRMTAVLGKRLQMKQGWMNHPCFYYFPQWISSHWSALSGGKNSSTGKRMRLKRAQGSSSAVLPGHSFSGRQ